MPVQPTNIRPPKNGAVRVPSSNSTIDLKLLRGLYEGVQEFGVQQGTASDDPSDDVEMSIITGKYDWRAYLREELDAPRDPKRFGVVPK